MYILGKATIVYLLLIANLMWSQNAVQYNCSHIEAAPVFLEVTPSSEPMDYLGQRFYIMKYEFKIGNEKYHSFYTYKFNNKLYVLDEDATSLNYTKDQVLFDINQDKNIISNVSGIFSEIDLRLDDRLKINKKDFYFYSTTSITFSSFNITKIIFDEKLDILQLDIKSYLGTTQCVMNNILVEPMMKSSPSVINLKNRQSPRQTKLKGVKYSNDWSK